MLDHTGVVISIQIPERSYPASGKPIDLTATITNYTGSVVFINSDCNGFIQVGLTNKRVAYGEIWPAILCQRGRLQPGITKKQLRLNTQYQSCGGGAGFAPKCLTGTTGSSLPPLPPGVYDVKVITSGIVAKVAILKPNQVTLTNA